MIARVAEDEFHAIELIDELDGDIEQRIRDYEVHLEDHGQLPPVAD